jgi:hypothetical protein
MILLFDLDHPYLDIALGLAAALMIVAVLKFTDWKGL